jgi:hypothetical protein
MGPGIESIEAACRQANIKRIARSLSLECRWSGALSSMYSVASHSVVVSFRCEELALLAGHSVAAAKSAALHGLMHDAAEAYTGDLITPIKDAALLKVGNRVLTWREWEDGLVRHIYRAIALPKMEAWEKALVDRADVEILLVELECLTPHQGHGLGGPTIDTDLDTEGFTAPEGWVVAGAPPEEAEADFLARFEELR